MLKDWLKQVLNRSICDAALIEMRWSIPVLQSRPTEPRDVSAKDPEPLVLHP